MEANGLRIVLFGMGQRFSEWKDLISLSDEVIAIIDNNATLWGKSCNEIIISKPENIINLCYDIVVIMSTKYSYSMKKQLIELEVKDSKIVLFDEYYSMRHKGIFLPQESRNDNESCSNRKILIITYWLDYNGGSMTAIYAAMAFIEKGFSVLLAVPGGNKKMIDECARNEIGVAVCQDLFSISEENLSFYDSFDFYLINTFQMFSCAERFSQDKPIMWWIHEPESIIRQYMLFTRINNNKRIGMDNIFAVSRNARGNFNRCFPSINVSIMTYGIPDTYNSSIMDKRKKEHLTVAIIGAICENKGQDILLKAVRKFNKDCAKQTEFWMIGETFNNKYCKMITKESNDIKNVIIKGKMSREEIEKAYRDDIDIVVCASRSETMSIVITEGMMHRKICITSKNAGIIDYIEDGVNGYAFTSDDYEELSDKMKWIIEKYGSLNDVRDKARNTYLQNFTIGALGERLSTVL
jgi:glycosyltransferase involved in cell wall biosynthesis